MHLHSPIAEAVSSSAQNGQRQAPAAGVPAAAPISQRVPYELMTDIFSHLENDQDVYRASLVSKRWHEAANDHILPLPKQRLVAKLAVAAHRNEPSWQRSRSLQTLLEAHFLAVGERQSLQDAQALVEGMLGTSPRFPTATEKLLQPMFFDALRESLLRVSPNFLELDAISQSVTGAASAAGLRSLRDLFPPYFFAKIERQAARITSRCPTILWANVALLNTFSIGLLREQSAVSETQKKFQERMITLGVLMQQNPDLERLAGLSEELLLADMNDAERRRFALIQEWAQPRLHIVANAEVGPEATAASATLGPDQPYSQTSIERAIFCLQARALTDEEVGQLIAPLPADVRRVDEFQLKAQAFLRGPYFAPLATMTTQEVARTVDSMQQRATLIEHLAADHDFGAKLSLTAHDLDQRSAQIDALLPISLAKAIRWLSKEHPAVIPGLEQAVLLPGISASETVFGPDSELFESSLMTAVAYERLRRAQSEQPSEVDRRPSLEVLRNEHVAPAVLPVPAPDATTAAPSWRAPNRWTCALFGAALAVAAYEVRSRLT